MNKQEVKARIEEIGIVPAIRLPSREDAVFAIESIHKAGIPVAEVTLTIPGAIEAISELARRHADLVVGAGTVMNVEAAHRCIDAGARFLTTTGLDLEIVEFAMKRDIVVFPGALTPSEVMAAWKAGSDFAKVFPCSAVGGASYIRALKSPFPHIPLIAAGGVNQQTCADFILAGASAVGVGRALVYPDAVQRREVAWIRELTQRFLHIIQSARRQRSGA